jgi:3-oxoacyl-[acyl-carrier protein] reductase
MSLQGKVALVTASSRGIGRAVALRLGADGANVVVNYRVDENAAADVVERIKAGGGDAVAVRADIGVPADVERLYQETLSAFGGLDIVVNNAGVTVVGPTAFFDEQALDRALAINVKGTFLSLKHAANHVRDGGRIINISTGYTRAPNPYVGFYVGTKAAVEQFGHSLAKELGGRRITVNSVLPGLTDTEGVAPEVRADADRYIGQTPLGRFGTPEDIAGVVGFLAGEDGAWVTGQAISATGGLA